ncbi:MAG TPA: SDR family NAD(P)-dependent oxidoreductase [Myxococcales bacterium]|jgi:NAD(P)-dependent dehydrogenase (short-subunit alcohol dehydrogenase family)|nr:SDR family NAD(P)-dependent oxidoreductase [Myxococcales bacterium]
MGSNEKGQVAVVVGVGAKQGLGAALARRFAREGLHTFVAGRTPERLEAVVEEIEASGGRATAVPCDATESAEVVALIDRAIEEGGRLDLVAYNVGNNQFSSLLDMTDEFFENLWRLCCFGGFIVGRESARRMLDQGSGTILFTGATASVRARPPFTAFASAKSALRSVAQGMAREFGPRGLHVGHVIIDGVIDGDQVNGRFPQLKEARGEQGMLNIDAIADAFWMLHTQHPSAWSQELDLRPFKEEF